jgi:hypothetical protein
MVPTAVWRRAFAAPAIAVTAFAGMANPEAGLRRICELNNHTSSMV